MKQNQNAKFIGITPHIGCKKMVKNKSPLDVPRIQLNRHCAHPISTPNILFLHGGVIWCAPAATETTFDIVMKPINSEREQTSTTPPTSLIFELWPIGGAAYYVDVNF